MEFMICRVNHQEHHHHNYDADDDDHHQHGLHTLVIE